MDPTDNPRATSPAEAAPESGLPEVPRYVSEVFDAAPVGVRAQLIETLMRPMGALGLVAVAGGAFAAVRQRNGWQHLRVTLDDAARISADQSAGAVHLPGAGRPGGLRPDRRPARRPARAGVQPEHRAAAARTPAHGAHGTGPVTALSTAGVDRHSPCSWGANLQVHASPLNKARYDFRLEHFTPGGLACEQLQQRAWRIPSTLTSHRSEG